MTKVLKTQCCIAGGGPAGVMLGFLLARAGVDVIVLEKHGDFFRDFRGDTIHPSTLELLHQMRLLEEFLKLPHQTLPEVNMVYKGEKIPVADFSHLNVVCRYIAFMPQWDFLNFMATRGKKYTGFHLYQNAEVTGLIRDDTGVCGVKVKSPEEEWKIHAGLTVGADGRSSSVRDMAGLKVIDTAVPIDVLWLRIPKSKDVQTQALGYVGSGKMMILIDRDEYFQCGFIIRKGQFDEIKQRGLEAFRTDIVSLAPFTQPYIDKVNNWDDIKLLTVQINHLPVWYTEGLLCIGDAAHAMSPAGGVGINLAIQDAVAAARILAPAFKTGKVSNSILAQVQARREKPARIIQNVQAFIHKNMVDPASAATTERNIRFPLWLFKHLPFLRRIPARYIGLGIRPEYVTPDAN